jgi:hypothetical protein
MISFREGIETGIYQLRESTDPVFKPFDLFVLGMRAEAPYKAENLK